MNNSQGVKREKKKSAIVPTKGWKKIKDIWLMEDKVYEKIMSIAYPVKGESKR